MAEFLKSVDGFLSNLMTGYDNYVYSPLQKCISPIVGYIPRNVGKEKNIPVFTANTITLARTFLILPIAWFIKYDYNFYAFLMVVLHDFLDHLDGIVAKVHKNLYPDQDDPLLGGFLDAFCDKIVNVFSIWAIIQTANFDSNLLFLLIFVGVCYTVIAYEVRLAVIRVNDYFEAKYVKKDDDPKITQASMEGKLKEKLESIGIALLCLTLNSDSGFYILLELLGFVSLLLSVRMAHKSLNKKIDNQIQRQKSNKKN